MLSFASDYTEGACEEILQKLAGDEPGESAGIWHGPLLPECRQKNTGGDRMPGGGGLFSGGRYPDECGRDQ